MTKKKKIKDLSRPTKQELLDGAELPCKLLGIKVPGKLSLKWTEVFTGQTHPKWGELWEETLEVHYRKPGAKRRKKLGYTSDIISLKGIEGDVIGLLRFLNEQQDRAEEMF